MNVQMRDRLSAVASTIDDQAKSRLRYSQRFGCFLGFEQQFAQQIPVLCRCFGETRDQFFRHQQHVNRRLWIDIVENDQVVIFRDRGQQFFETASSNREEDISFNVGPFEVCSNEIYDFVSKL
jgi:hypothetical protein